MAIHPDSNFPIPANEQADVIQIFLELMIELHRDSPAPEVTTDQPARWCCDADDSRCPGELPDSE